VGSGELASPDPMTVFIEALPCHHILTSDDDRRTLQ